VGQLLGGWRIALRRFRTNWLLMLLVGVGALLATTLLAAAPIYTQALSDIGLRFRLERGLDEQAARVAFVSAEGLPLGDAVANVQRESIDAITAARVGWLGDGVLVEERSRALALGFAEPGSDEVDAARRQWPAHLVHLSGFEQHVEVVEGRLPDPEGASAEVVLPDGLQREAAVGDVLVLRDRTYDDCRRVPPSEDPDVAAEEVQCVPTTFVSVSTLAVVVGFVRPRDPDDPRWRFFSDGWTPPQEPPVPGLAAREGQGPLPLLTTREQYFEVFARLLPEMTVRHRAGIVPDLDALAVGDVPRAIDDLEAWSADIRDALGVPVAARAELAAELTRFRTLQTFSQVPLLLILLQVAGVVAFYVVVLMAGVRERQAEELAVFRSRGASAPQILGLALVEGVLLAVPAALLGPWLAARAVEALGRTPAFEPLTGGAALPAAVGDDAALLAAAGAALVLVAMLLPTLLAARRGIIDAKREQSRPPARSILQRYYLDVGAVALAGVLLWQLDRRGTVFDPSSVGGWSADPLLLASPLVLTVAAAAIIMRAYPLLLRLAARLARPFRGTSVLLGVGRAGREPGATGRLVLLLSMAVAVGTFAASYAPTVERSLDERARYEAGVDVRGTLASFRLPETRERLEAVRAIDGVVSAQLVHRGSIATGRGEQIELLAVEDLDAAAAALWFREDFADEPAPDLLRRIEAATPPGGGLALPDDAVTIELDAFVEPQPRIGRIRARFRDADGNTDYVLLSAVPVGEWGTISAALPERPPRPLTLIALHVNDLPLFVGGDGALYLDDLRAVRAGGERVLLESFERDFGWTMFSQRAGAESFGPAQELVRSGAVAARWTWTREVTQRERVFALDDPALPLPAIVSDRGLSLLRAGVGDRATAFLGEGFAIPVAVQGRAALFPTLDPARGFLVVELARLQSIAGVLDAEAQRDANELWLDLDDTLTLARGDRLRPHAAGLRQRHPAARVRRGAGRGAAGLRRERGDDAARPRHGVRRAALARQLAGRHPARGAARVGRRARARRGGRRAARPPDRDADAALPRGHRGRRARRPRVRPADRLGAGRHRARRARRRGRARAVGLVADHAAARRRRRAAADAVARAYSAPAPSSRSGGTRSTPCGSPSTRRTTTRSPAASTPANGSMRNSRRGARNRISTSLPPESRTRSPSRVSTTVPARSTSPGSAGSPPKPVNPPAERSAEAGVSASRAGSVSTSSSAAASLARSPAATPTTAPARPAASSAATVTAAISTAGALTASRPRSRRRRSARARTASARPRGSRSRPPRGRVHRRAPTPRWRPRRARPRAARGRSRPPAASPRGSRPRRPRPPRRTRRLRAAHPRRARRPPRARDRARTRSRPLRRARTPRAARSPSAAPREPSIACRLLLEPRSDARLPHVPTRPTISRAPRRRRQLSALPWATDMDDALVGRLLIATPALLDPNFVRSVVLICQQNEEGALGVILNRPLDAEVGEHLPEWLHLASSPPRIFEGGPVQREIALAVGRRRDGTPGEGWTEVTRELGLLDLGRDPADLWGELVALRIFAGYAGWSASQLAGEIEERAWFVVDAAPSDPFSEQPEQLWEQVLRRQQGPLSMFATFPQDPSLN
jgi:putative transcriptional regulator